MKKITKAAIAGVAGAALLLGGAGTLAYWNDTKTGDAVTIAAGDLKFGTFTDGTGWSLQQKAADLPAGTAEPAGVAYTNQLIVPGDVLSKTINVPVTITGENNKAQFTLTRVTPPANNLSTTLQPAVTVNGTAYTPGNPLTLAAGTTTIPVTVTVTFPWGTAVDNTTKTLTTNYQLQYNLTQIPETPAAP